MMNEKRKTLAKDLGIPIEDASRILIEKERVVMQSEVKYHVKALCALLDRMKKTDADSSDQLMKESVKFLLARHATVDTLEEMCDYIEGLSENFFEKEFTGSLGSYKDEF